MLYDITIHNAQSDKDIVIALDVTIIEIAQYKERLSITTSKVIAGEKIECEMRIPGSILIGKQIIIKAKNE